MQTKVSDIPIMCKSNKQPFVNLHLSLLIKSVVDCNCTCIFTLFKWVF